MSLESSAPDVDDGAAAKGHDRMARLSPKSFCGGWD